ncbi:MAG TPA: hypothetical protein PLD25_00980 [Chloroflexota bacterium]|nr:hypothetical protein [Chloroflexota bacterium]
MSDTTPPAEQRPETAVPENAIPTDAVSVDTAVAPHRTARLVGIGLIILSVVMAWLLLVGYMGYQSGQRQFTDRQQSALLANLERQTTLAAENISQGNYALALRRLEWVLAREPQNSEALRLQSEASQALTAQSQPAESPATPTPPQPTATPEPSPTPGLIASPEEELQRLRRLSVNKEWAEAVSGLVAFQQQFPSHERDETDRLLFDAYLGYSQSLFESNRSEQGLYYLSQAQKLGGLPQAMLDYQTWAELYTQGISFYGVNWDAAAYYFRDLCLAAPFYGDACAKLLYILVARGDQYAFVEDWCPAQSWYEEAWRQSNSGELAGKLAAARDGCLMATPVPSEPITDTVPLTHTQPITGAPFILP